MSYALSPNLYLSPTPAGAFNAAAEPNSNRLRRFIGALLALEVTPAASDAGLQEWSGSEQLDDAYQLVWRMQEVGWLQGLTAPRRAPEGPMEEILPQLLPQLTHGGKVLLADGQGFYVSSLGFPHEVAEELSALSADIANLHQRRSGSLNRNLGLSGSAWGLSDAAGQSQLGFWPLYAGKERFVLVVAGIPAFNRPQLIDLVWMLHRRYALQQQP